MNKICVKISIAAIFASVLLKLVLPIATGNPAFNVIDSFFHKQMEVISTMGTSLSAKN